MHTALFVESGKIKGAETASRGLMMREQGAKRMLAASKTGFYLVRGEYEWQDCPILGGRRLFSSR
jgi:hypothetical protein